MQFLRTLTSLFGNIGLRDLVDIGAVGFVFFLLFYMLKVSRSYLALRSLIILTVTTILIYSIAAVFELSGLSLIFSRFWIVAIIIYLIVYQSSFRRAFQELGQVRLVRALIRTDTGHHLRALAGAVGRLSEKRLGALFVLERRVDVLPLVVSPGVEIDAIPSEELIVSLFFSYNPLHDGAVIIESDRIARANVMLPITRSTTIPKGLGTRHRAAIEISEISDAVAVVVSEETGTISIVLGGVIERNLTPEELLRALGKAMNVRGEAGAAAKEGEAA